MPKILLVEDDEHSSMLLSRRLARRDFDVITAEDGVEAVQTCLAESPDLVLMDVSLPRLNGYEATRQLREQDATKATPVIMLTAHATAEHRQEALDAGANDFATKPVEFESLIRKIQTLLEPGTEE